MGSSRTKSTCVWNGSICGGVDDDGDGEGEPALRGGRETGSATADPGTSGSERMKAASAVSASALARAALLQIRGRDGPFTFLDELFDSLATFLSDAFVEVWAVAIARSFAALLSTFFPNLLVKSVTVSLFGGKAAFTADPFVELRTVLSLYGLAASLSGFANG